MPGQNYQPRGSSSRTALITIRVSPAERELLHKLAQERGETLSRMMVSRSLIAHKRAKPQSAERQPKATKPVAVRASECAPQASVPARSETKALRGQDVISGQRSLFDELGGR